MLRSLRCALWAATPFVVLLTALCTSCERSTVDGGTAELEFTGGALDGSDDERLAAEFVRTESERVAAAAAVIVDYDTPIQQLVEEMGLTYDESNAMILLPEDVVRQLAAARKAGIAFDAQDRTPPTALAGGRLGIRFRHLALDVLDDGPYEALLDSLVGRTPEGVEPGDEPPVFPASIAALDGKDVTLVGYMIPVEWDDAEVLEFMLVRDLLACCFGGAPQADEWVKVRMAPKKGARYFPYVPVVVEGRLQIEGMADANGYAVGCYRMTATKVRRED